MYLKLHVYGTIIVISFHNWQKPSKSNIPMVFRKHMKNWSIFGERPENPVFMTMQYNVNVTSLEGLLIRFWCK